MGDDYPKLLDAIRRVFPASRLTPLGEAEVAAVREQFPGVPEDYLAILRRVGYGSLGDGNFMLYGGPCAPADFFDPGTAAALDGIVFFGDDFAGWMAGFDARGGWRLVGVDSASPVPYPLPEKTAGEFITRRVADSA